MLHLQSVRSTLGFTLVEIAIVLVIVGLLLGGLLMPIATQVQVRRVEETKRSLAEIKEALIGYAIVNGALPCPDSSVPPDGVADPIPGPCTSNQGVVPWVTLGINGTDVWGNRFRYQVSGDFSGPRVPGNACAHGDGVIGLCDANNGLNVDVEMRNPVSKALQTQALNVAAVVLSYGPNGYGAIPEIGVIHPLPPAANADEAINATPGPIAAYRMRPATAGANVCSDTAAGQLFCEFDDIVDWLAPGPLFDRMMSAGQLP